VTRGLFKDMKNIRESAAEHGGMPNRKDSFAKIHAVFDDHGEREILANGISAKAIVTGIPSAVPDQYATMQIPVEVHPPSGSPYPLNYVFPAARMQAALVIGMEVPVKISPDDPNRIAVQWDAQMASIAASGGTMAAVKDAMANARETGLIQTPTIPGTVADPAARIKSLDDLLASGAIDQATYATKKQQIIDGI
jgi:hypothetical protein